MSYILNITNGDAAVEIMKQADIPGEFLPWQDVLHDGPVPHNHSFSELSHIRAEFIAEMGWGEAEQINASFNDRARVLDGIAQYDRVTLWFEHDLYDQLQLLQILDWFAEHNPPVELSMVCTDNYLGMQSPEQMAELQRFEKTVSTEQLQLATDAWQAFISPTPRLWHALLYRDTDILPFLNGAIVRFLQEYPDPVNGLSRTERTILQLVDSGVQHPGKLFGEYQMTEERQFMGDLSFLAILHRLLEADRPLLHLSGDKPLNFPPAPDQMLSLTTTGREVMDGKLNWVSLAPPDRWLGGVHLTRDDLWFWDRDIDTLSR